MPQSSRSSKSKSRPKVIELAPSQPSQPRSPFEVLEDLLAQARALAPGSDVEGFLEERLPELTRRTRATVAQGRADDQAASSREEGFPPSGVSPLPPPDASGPK